MYFFTDQHRTHHKLSGLRCPCSLSCFSRVQLCATNPMDSIPPGSSVHGIFQARTVDWVPMPSSRGSSQPRDSTPVTYISCTGRQALYLEPPGKPRGLWHTYLLSHNSDFESSKPRLDSCWGYHKANIKALTRLDSHLETHWTCESSRRPDRPFLTLVPRISKYLPPLLYRSFGSPVLRILFPLLPCLSAGQIASVPPGHCGPCSLVNLTSSSGTQPASRLAPTPFPT